MNKYYKTIQISQSCTPTAPAPSTQPISTPASPGPTGIIYAPYIPIYNTFGSNWKLIVYLDVKKRCHLPQDVYDESIKLLNKKLKKQIPNMVSWKLDKLQAEILILFRSFSQYKNYDNLNNLEHGENSIIPYYLNVTLVNSYDKSKSPTDIVSIAGDFEKNYHDKNSNLIIYVKGKMLVAINKDVITEFQVPNEITPWKIITKQNPIKKIIPERLEAFEGSRKLEI